MSINIEHYLPGSKVDKLADAIQTAIETDIYREGEVLPSINTLSAQYGVSRDTVFKAFTELRKRGIIDSNATKGYYVCRREQRILLLLDKFSGFKTELYNALRECLPQKYSIDLSFHHYNPERFENTIRESAGRYNFYMVMNYAYDRYADILDLLDNNKVVLIDYGKFEKDRFAYVCQGFDTTLYSCLASGLDRLLKYRRMVVVFPESSEHPRSCVKYFEKFCRDFSFEYTVTESITEDMIEDGTVYFLTSHDDVPTTCELIKKKGLALGQQAGLVAFNDDPFFEIAGNGISAISVDFREMGTLAALFVRTHEKMQVYVPTRLIVRGSL